MSDLSVNYDFTHGHKDKQLQKWSGKYEGTQSYKYKHCLTGLPITILHMVTNTSNAHKYEHLLTDLLILKSTYGCKYKQMQKWSAKYDGTHKYKHCQIDLLIMIVHMATNVNNSQKSLSSIENPHAKNIQECLTCLPIIEAHMSIQTNNAQLVCQLGKYMSTNTSNDQMVCQSMTTSTNIGRLIWQLQMYI